jgi:ABC-2 type transport system permease protein
MLILIVMPVVMIILFGFALTTEVKNVNVAILTSGDSDNAVRQITKRLDASEYFTVCQSIHSSDEIDRLFRSGEVDLVIAFGENFSKELYAATGSNVQIVVDASDVNMAQSYTTYAESIINQYYAELLPPDIPKGIVPNVVLLYNPQMKSSYNFVPGIMGLTLMLICAMMTSIAIVKEKETGTMEVLLASPIRATHIIIAKMIPYFTISCFNLLTILLLSIHVLHVPVAGSLLALCFVSLLYIFIALALGLLVSTLVEQQAVAMLLSSMLLMVPTILLSGMVFPIESMPGILQYVAYILPPTWYISAVRKLMIAGLPVVTTAKEIIILTVMATVLTVVSFKKFKNRLDI